MAGSLTDEFRVEFLELADQQAIHSRYPKAHQRMFEVVEAPVTVVEMWYRVANSQIDFGPKHTKLPGFQMKGLFFNRCGVAININDP